MKKRNEAPIVTVHDAAKERWAAKDLLDAKVAKRELPKARKDLARAEANLAKFGGEAWARCVATRQRRVADYESML